MERIDATQRSQVYAGGGRRLRCGAGRPSAGLVSDEVEFHDEGPETVLADEEERWPDDLLGACRDKLGPKASR